ncbi:MAG: hypothetical protein AAF791_09965 [Bacteroidota bacterium]
MTREAWDEWVQYRRERRNALTPTAIRRQSTQLITWTEQGHDPNQILATSITNSWTGLFEPDASGGSSGAGTRNGHARRGGSGRSRGARRGARHD